MRSLVLGLVLTTAGLAQSGAVVAVPGSQSNSPPASLSASGAIRTFQQAPVPFVGTSPQSSSATLLASSVFAQLVPPMLPVTDLNLVFGGGPNAPYALVATALPLNIPCSTLNPACGTVQPWMPASLPTAVGTFHVGFPFIPVLDGIGLGGSLSAVLDAQGAGTLSVSVPWSSTQQPFAPESFAVQALMVDPTAPLGFRFSAAFSNQRIAISCAVCQ